MSHKVFLSRLGRLDASWIEAAREAVHVNHGIPIDMHLFTSSPHTPAEYCAEKVRDSDVFVTVAGADYGSIVPGRSISYCEFEYETAVSSGLPVLAFIIEDESYQVDEKQARFIERLRSAHLVSVAASPEALRRLVSVALIEAVMQSKKRVDSGRVAPVDRRFREALVDDLTRVWMRDYMGEGLISNLTLPLSYEQRNDLLTPRVWVIDEGDGDLNPTGNLTTSLPEKLSARRMLVLGKPGSGKTTYLLRLAAAKLAGLDVTVDEALPVVLNLSSWNPRFRTLERWIRNELLVKYSSRSSVASSWLANGSLSLYLDGLDELEEVNRSRCVEAINRFLSDFGHIEVTVASRTLEYSEVGAQLDIPVLVEITSLDLAEAKAILRGAGLADVASHLDAHASSWESTYATPLALSVLITLFEARSEEGTNNEDGIVAVEGHGGLFDRYVDHALKPSRRIPSEYLAADAKPPKLSPGDSKRFLSQVAESMYRSEAGTTLRPAEWSPRWLRRPWSLVVRAIRLAIFSVLVSAGLTLVAAYALLADNDFKPETGGVFNTVIDLARASVPIFTVLLTGCLTLGVALATSDRSGRLATIVQSVVAGAIAWAVIMGQADAYRLSEGHSTTARVAVVVVAAILCAEALRGSRGHLGWLAPALLLGTHVGVLVFVTAALDGGVLADEIFMFSLGGLLVATLIGWAAVSLLSTAAQQAHRVALAAALGGFAAMLLAARWDSEPPFDLGDLSASLAFDMLAVGGHGLEELQRIGGVFGLAAAVMYLNRPDHAEEVLFSSNAHVHWSINSARDRRWYANATLLMVGAIGGAALAALFETGGDAEKVAATRLGIAPAILGIAAAVLLLGLRRLPPSAQLSATRVRWGEFGASVVISAAAALVFACFASAESTLIGGGTVLVLTAGRPVASEVSHRLVAGALVRQGTIPGESADLFHVGLSSGLLRPEAGGFRYAHENFRRHLANLAPESATRGPSTKLFAAVASPVILAPLVVFGLLTGVGWLAEDRSDAVQLNRFTNEIAYVEGDYLFTSHDGVFDVSGSAPQPMNAPPARSAQTDHTYPEDISEAAAGYYEVVWTETTEGLSQRSVIGETLAITRADGGPIMAVVQSGSEMLFLRRDDIQSWASLDSINSIDAGAVVAAVNSHRGRIAVLLRDEPTAVVFNGDTGDITAGPVPGSLASGTWAEGVAVSRDRLWVVTNESVDLFPGGDSSVGRLHEVDLSQFVPVVTSFEDQVFAAAYAWPPFGGGDESVDRVVQERWAAFVASNHPSEPWTDAVSARFNLADGNITSAVLLFPSLPEPPTQLEDACQAATVFMLSIAADPGAIRVTVGSTVAIELVDPAGSCRLPG